MKEVKAYSITDTRLIESVYDGSRPSKTQTKQTYILTNRSIEPTLGETVRTLFSIDNYELKSGETVEIPLNFMTSVHEIPFEEFQGIFKMAGGTIKTKTRSNSQSYDSILPGEIDSLARLVSSMPKSSVEQVKATENEDRSRI